MVSLDEALGETPEPQPEPVVQDEATDKVSETQEDATGETESAKPAETSANVTDEGAESESSVPLKALEAERHKRQELERKLEQQYRDLKTQSEEKQRPDILEDPDGYADSITRKFQQELDNQRLNMSEFLARREHPDMDDKLAEYRELAEKNPALNSQVQNAMSPWHEVAKIVDASRKLEQLNDVDGMEAKLRAEIEAQIRKEYEDKAKAEEVLSGSLPQSLAGAPSKGSVKGSNWSGPTPLENII